MLEWVPARLRVLRIRRPKYACRTCGTVTQAPVPERVIAGGLATPASLAQVLVGKNCDHRPLYRQSRIFARRGIGLDRSTLAGWVGGACWWPDALHERLGRDIFASESLFADVSRRGRLRSGNRAAVVLSRPAEAAALAAGSRISGKFRRTAHAVVGPGDFDRHLL
jgi:hypothetical protein